ncbi:lysophospholipid acyltransferase family protein [Aminobacterium colombiense]|jgi:1-acyl-sn-glycerol-3-phosphate acyltransferase|uniref:Phospholipid/glycerol acyltransferase n=1 Tax=Aminobacterium colombiense (strain DSM 12261 / ALA-1) TaxID=572547 RepID=D5EF80_AMICL|nr:lysophospholipid acyltransferase family protein [Aminobacterium colombiense]ADE57212.1 phospholipid/glycerol acyltransferase [Aminobacterium colombiense DSM 12261]MDD4585001.1 lysophospholipid acyltransferase family protein [Aminobacterium colombiense]
MRHLFYTLTKIFCFIVLKLYNRLSVRWLASLPKEDPVIVVANHCSNLDPIIIGALFPRRLRYLAKSELFSTLGMSLLIRTLGAIPVKKQDLQSAGAALKAFLDLLEKGENVLLFPEGARSLNGKLQPLQGGVALIAMKSGAPVIPAFIKGSFESMPPGASFVRPNRIQVTFGEAIYPRELETGLSAKDSRQQFLDRVYEALENLEKSD